MKNILIIALLGFASLTFSAHQGTSASNQTVYSTGNYAISLVPPPRLPGPLVKVESLTESEVKQLTDAYAAVAEANKKLKQVQASIAQSHNMIEQHWMEGSSWYDFNGGWILYYYQTFHYSNIGW